MVFAPALSDQKRPELAADNFLRLVVLDASKTTTH
jgi:hypothetical protein